MIYDLDFDVHDRLCGSRVSPAVEGEGEGGSYILKSYTALTTHD